MTDPVGRIEPLHWDSEFWGRRVGVVHVGASESSLTDDVRRQLRADYDLVYLLAPAGNLALVQSAERLGFTITDLRCTVTRALPNLDGAPASGPTPMPTAQGSQRLERAAELAGRAHTNTRFANDPSLDPGAVAELYRRWLIRDAARDGWSVDVLSQDDDVMGYVSYGPTADGVGSVGLIGVAAEARGQQLGARLLRHAMDVQRLAGCTSMEVITQGGSAAAMAMYRSAGFTVERLEIWLHWHRRGEA